MNVRPSFESAVAAPAWIDLPHATVFLTVPLATIRGTLVAEMPAAAVVFSDGEDFGVAELWACDLATGKPAEQVRVVNGGSASLSHHVAVAIAAELETDAGRRAALDALDKEIAGRHE